MNQQVGYAKLHAEVATLLPPPRRPGFVASSVNRRVDTEDRVLFPRGVAVEDTLAGHVEFALRHEDLQLPLLEAALQRIPRDEMAGRFRASPNGEYVRRMAYLWEWLRNSPLDAGARPTASYVPLLDPAKYRVVENPRRAITYRVLENQLGNRDFSPIVRRTRGTDRGREVLAELVAELQQSLSDGEKDGDLYQRALSYIYLAETRSSFKIEKEEPTSSKEAAFVSLLSKAGEKKTLDEDWLVELQHLAVRNAFSHEHSFRGDQNWLDRDGSRVDYFPPAPEDLRPLMDGLMAFANEHKFTVDPIAKAAIVSFGFVYAHPFKDGNGRLHRFLLHHALAQSGLVPEGLVMPVSAVLSKNIDRYFATLTSFSEPITRLWEYRRADDRPIAVSHPGRTPYAYWDATGEVELTSWALSQAVRVEVPFGVRYLAVFDQAKTTVDREFDLPSKDISMLVKCAIDQGGKLSIHRRKQFKHLPDTVLDRVEAIVAEQLAEHPSSKVQPT
ncbi:MAG: Fic family protein [Burkholderiales bacterium]